MSIIGEIIPEQGFEKVRDVIGAVLKTELENQKELQGFSEDINVYVGRSTPFQQDEIFMINVLLDSSNYGTFSEAIANGTVSYNIDIFASGKASDGVIGGYDSAKRRDKFLGMCRYILQHTKYKTLSMPLGLIMGTYCNNFEIFDSPNAQDSSFVTMARLSFEVRIVENQNLWSGVNLSESFTSIKLDLTDKGYKYELN